jgi:hypothetical protein
LKEGVVKGAGWHSKKAASGPNKKKPKKPITGIGAG